MKNDTKKFLTKMTILMGVWAFLVNFQLFQWTAFIFIPVFLLFGYMATVPNQRNVKGYALAIVISLVSIPWLWNLSGFLLEFHRLSSSESWIGAWFTIMSWWFVCIIGQVLIKNKLTPLPKYMLVE